MTIGTKIISGYLVILTLLVAVTATGLYSLVLVKNSYSEYLDVHDNLIEDANELRFKAMQQVANYRGLLLYPQMADHYLGSLQKGYQEFNEQVEAMHKRLLTEVGRDLLAEIARLQARRQQAIDNVIALLQEGRREEAMRVSGGEVLPLTQELLAKVKDFTDRQERLAAERHEEIAARVKFNTILMVIAALLALTAGLLIGFYLNRSVTRQLRDSISQLAASSAEILTATTQVASGAAETATSVSETTTTVEEVKQTAQVSSQKAKQVSERAQQAAQVAHKGKKTVEASVTGMYHIQGQMESIATSIVGLSEQSQAIGEIIATVNNLAEQSNLLAVNAAIEAAKAGEHGKGFAVVAQEVRSLAGQSRQATAQVRTILGDIQKETGSVVMAAEQGSKAVASGLEQVGEAGESISALANSVAEAAQAAVQIAASSQQQLIGMDQVVMAMENIKQATAQHVAGAKQVESVARNLHDLGQRLEQLVQRRKA